MSAQPSTFVPFTPEERASFLAHRFGSTLDWSSQILVEINYPVEEARWFVDAVQGICKGKDRRIAHATLATRAQRFKNPSQAKSLVKRAIASDRDWSRLHRRMVFDIESPKPNEREGKDKRARTRYTDYLTPTGVWAQEAEHRVKKSNEVRWKNDIKYRLAERRKILAAAIEMLPSFGCVEDMPPTAQPKEPNPLSIGEYIERRREIMLAENRRVHDKICDGALIEVDEIDARIAALEVHYSKALHELKESFESTRNYLLKQRSARLERAADLTDPLEAVAPVDEILATKGVAHVPLSDCEIFPAEWPREFVEPETKGVAHVPLSASIGNGKDSTKGVAGVPLSVSVSESDFEEVVIGESQDATEAAPPLTQFDCALNYVALGLPVFPTKPDKRPYTLHGFKDASTDPAQIRAWWKVWPDAGIGIPTGKASGWLVLDIDIDKGGDANLSSFVEQHGDLPPTGHAKTPRNGDHFYFKNPADVEIRNSESKIGKGIDIRGEGGYVVAPGCDPSRRWTNSLDAAEPPAWLVEAAVSAKHEPVNTDRKVLHYPFSGARYFPEGERNAGLRDVACGRWTHGYATDAQDLYEQLLQVRGTRCAPGKDSPATDADLWKMALRTTQKFTRGELKREVSV